MARVTLNTAGSHFEAETPEGEIYGPEEIDECGHAILEDTDTGISYLIMLGDGGDVLKPNTLYQLVEVPTVSDTVDEFEDDEDDDDPDPGEEVAA
jgi:hypothetical protein